MGRHEPKRTRSTKKPDSGNEGAKEDEADPNSLVEWVKSLAFAFVLFLVFRTFLIATFVITSGSMENTLLVGDFLLVNRAAIGARVPFTNGCCR